MTGGDRRWEVKQEGVGGGCLGRGKVIGGEGGGDRAGKVIGGGGGEGRGRGEGDTRRSQEKVALGGERGI